MSIPSLVDPYDTFLECNSLGVVNLMKGNLPEAYRHLCTAFDIARQEQTAVEQEQGSPAASADGTSNNVTVEPASQGPLGLAPWPLLSQEELVRTLSLTKTFDLRMDGLTISADALVRRGDRRGLLGRDDWILASAFVVYNLGVVYLIGGTQGSNEAHHDKARMMFESSLGLILCSCRHDRQVLNRESSAAMKRLCATGNPIVDVLSLMVLAKTSQAYHFLSRFDGARAYARHLGDYMRLLREDGRTYSGDDLINGLIQSHCERLASELSSILKLETLSPAA
jgi:hypothetical protein